MRRILVVLMVACAGIRAADNRLTGEEKKAGWKLLFDGKSFRNWEDPAKKSPAGDGWKIADGCLEAVANPKIQEDLFSVGRYGDFELEWDWQISAKGNSGVKYRIKDQVFVGKRKERRFEDKVNAALAEKERVRLAAGEDYVVGFEFQMTDNAANPDAVGRGPMHQSGALYDMIAPVNDVTKPVGEFNHARVVVRGTHVEHWLNGVKVVDGDLASEGVVAGIGKRWAKGSAVFERLVGQEGGKYPISLQNHRDTAWFKNIKIRELR